MKVMCILPIDTTSRGKEKHPRPEVGDICTVTEQYKSRVWDAIYYRLKDYPKDCGYLAECFAILPEPDVDEMKEAERESIVNIETAIV